MCEGLPPTAVHAHVRVPCHGPSCALQQSFIAARTQHDSTSLVGRLWPWFGATYTYTYYLELKLVRAVPCCTHYTHTHDIQHDDTTIRHPEGAHTLRGLRAGTPPCGLLVLVPGRRQ